jgi:hypothetical protein
VTELVTRLAPARRADGNPADGVLCVLGAGNCNDLDLPGLVTVFDRIHLVDIDADALRTACSRGPTHAGVRAHGGIDLTSISVERLVGAVEELSDVVVSTTLLTQLVADSHDDRGQQPLTVAELVSVRARHLHQMNALLRPGGWGLLVNDLASSTTVPGLAAVPEPQLPALLRTLVTTGNFFAGSNPYAICAQLMETATPGGRVAEVTLHPPWVWRVSDHTSRLTYGVTFRHVDDVGPRPLRHRHRDLDGTRGLPTSSLLR